MHHTGVRRESTKRRSGTRSSRLSEAALARFHAETQNESVGARAAPEHGMPGWLSCMPSTRCCGPPSKYCNCLEARDTVRFTQGGGAEDTAGREAMALAVAKASREAESRQSNRKSSGPKVRVLSSTRTMKHRLERPGSPHFHFGPQDSFQDVSVAARRSAPAAFEENESLLARTRRTVGRVFSRPRSEDIHPLSPRSPSMRFSETRPVEVDPKPQTRPQSTSAFSSGFGWRKIVHAERPWPGAKPSTLGQAKAILLHQSQEGSA
mmetsp:Transcript_9490/g.30313  ORF Transcript_9490/g.30313 Transcript_9490/m.30313 type:complete len:265 (+) Transcript_9490:36-830(+)